MSFGLKAFRFLIQNSRLKGSIITKISSIMYISRPIIKETYELDFISLEEVKHHLRIQYSTDDGLIFGMLHAAVESAETFLRMHIIKKEAEIIIIGNLDREIKINSYPINHIISFDYIYQSKKISLKDKEEFELDKQLGTIFLQKKYPADRSSIIIEIGYGKSIPASIKQGIIRHVQHMYDGKSLDEAFAEVVPLYKNHRRYSL